MEKETWKCDGCRFACELTRNKDENGFNDMLDCPSFTDGAEWHKVLKD